MSEGISHEFLTTLANTAAVLVDMDGCLIASGRPLPGALELVKACHERLWLVSNNSSHSAQELSHYLHGLGLEIPPGRMILAGELVLEEAQRQFPNTPAMILARRQFREYAASIGLVECDDTPGVIILTRDEALSYQRLTVAIKHLERGVPLLVANPDLSHPDADGDPVPETGSLLAMIKSVVPKVDYQVFGKPSACLFEAAMRRAGISAEQCLMVGDNPRTDCDGAESIGIKSFLIGRHEDALAPDLLGLMRISSMA